MSKAGLRNDEGFTLLELLVAVVVTSLIAGIVSFSGQTARTKANVMTATTRLERAVTDARRAARIYGQPSRLTFDLDQNQMRLSNETQPRPLPDDVTITVTSAAELGTPRRPVVAFFPDGTSSGAEITLVAQALTERRRIDWLTGRMETERDAAR